MDKYHVENFNPDLDNDGANYNPNSLKKKKNNTIINVKKGY